MWVYISVVFELSWPNKFWIYRMSVPFSSKCVAKLCRNVWTLTFFRIPALETAALTIFWMLRVVYWDASSWPSNNQFDRIYRLILVRTRFLAWSRVLGQNMLARLFLYCLLSGMANTHTINRPHLRSLSDLGAIAYWLQTVDSDGAVCHQIIFSRCVSVHLCLKIVRIQRIRIPPNGSLGSSWGD